MRNLKKILALVLSLVMTFSVMSVASAAFKDAEDVNAAYTDAVDLLSYLGIFNGYEDGTFKPQGDITRAEVAAIIYRIDTGDVLDTHKNIYSDYNRFEDVKSTSWYAGYVNYCANAEFVKGRTESTFDPNGKVTGYEVLAMILRVVGYDQNDEFSGSQWKIQVASTAQQLGITDRINSTTLNAAATRDLVAELLWRTVYEVPQVTYNMLMQGYNPYQDAVPNANSKLNNTINEDNWMIREYEGTDTWGRPGYGYFHDTDVADKVYDAENEASIVFYTDTPDAVYTEAVDQCTIVKDTGLKGAVAHYINGVKKNNTITSTHNTVNHIEGAQGTVVEIYKSAKTVVEIDTYLAQVTDVVEPKFDKKGHPTNTPYDEFTIFGAPVATAKTGNNNFELGVYYLVNYNEAYEYVAPYAVAETMDGYQTKIWWNAEKHTIEKVDYLDNVNYTLDDAGFDKDNAYTWFFDTYGNVIGSAEIYVPATPAQYAVVHAVQWVNGVGQYGYTLAKVQYMDGTIVEDAVIASVNGKAMQYAGTKPTTAEIEAGYNCFNEEAKAYTTMQYNMFTTEHLYEVTTNRDGSLNLVEVENEIAEVEIKKGVSQLGDTGVYTDSKTLFAYWIDTDGDRVKETLTIVEGYNNGELVKKMKGLGVDYVLAAGQPGLAGFAAIVYVPATGALPGATDTDLEKLVYFTNETTCYELKDQFVVYGAYGTDGKQAPLYFDIDAFGTEQETAMVLDAMVEAYKDTLAVVTYSKLYSTVSNVAPIFDEVTDNDNYGTAKLVTKGSYKFFNREVLKIDTLALNIISSTKFINQDGELISIEDAMLANQNLYVVYKGTNAVAVFVTPTTGSTIGAYMEDLTAKNFKAETAGLVYTIAADAEAGELTYTVDGDVCVADLKADIENSGVVAAIEMAGEAVEVAVNFAKIENGKAVYEVVLTCGDETKTVEVSFKVVEVEAEA